MSIHPDDFTLFNGYPNILWGWGAEDDNLFERLHLKGLLQDCAACNQGNYKTILRPPPGFARFSCMQDMWHTPRVFMPGFSYLDQTARHAWELQSGRWQRDGLNSLKYHVADPLREIKELGELRGGFPFRLLWIAISADPVLVCFSTSTSATITVSATMDGVQWSSCHICDDRPRDWCHLGGKVPEHFEKNLTWLLAFQQDSRNRTYTIGEKRFNEAFQRSIHHILRWHCPTCIMDHQALFYRRLTKPTRLEPYRLVACHWASDDNVLGEDFSLHSSLEDALTGKNPLPWLCPTSPATPSGFPGDCHPADNAWEKGNRATFVVPGCENAEPGRQSSLYVYLGT